MIKIPKDLALLVQAFLSLNWLVGLMRIVVENTAYCFTWTVGESKNTIESILEKTQKLYNLLSDTYVGTWFPMVERGLHFLFDPVPIWLVELVTLLIFTVGAASRYKNHNYRMKFERRAFDSFRDRLKSAWKSNHPFREAGPEVIDGILVTLNYPAYWVVSLMAKPLAPFTAQIAEKIGCRFFDQILSQAGYDENENPRRYIRRNLAKKKPDPLVLAVETGNLTPDPITNSHLHIFQEWIFKIHSFLVVFLVVIIFVSLFIGTGQTCLWFWPPSVD